MDADPKWYREMARQWRELAEVGDQAEREKRLRLAAGMEELADRMERESRKGG